MYKDISDLGGFLVGLVFIFLVFCLILIGIIWVFAKIVDIRQDRKKNQLNNEQVRILRAGKERP